MILYRLTFASGKVYIGQTVRAMHVRLQQHRALANGGSPLAVHCAWRKHGEPVIDILSEHDDRASLNAAEIEAIASHGSLSPVGYNIALGGHDGAVKSSLVRAKMSASSMGVLHTDETKAKIAEGSRKNWENPEYREKVISAVNDSFTPERRAAISKAAKRTHAGKIVSDETKAKLRSGTVSAETRAKMSAAAKARGANHHFSAETRAKLSASVKASHNGKARGASISAGLKAKHRDMTQKERDAFSDVRKRAWETRRANTQGEL